MNMGEWEKQVLKFCTEIGDRDTVKRVGLHLGDFSDGQIEQRIRNNYIDGFQTAALILLDDWSNKQATKPRDPRPFFEGLCNKLEQRNILWKMYLEPQRKDQPTEQNMKTSNPNLIFREMSLQFADFWEVLKLGVELGFTFSYLRQMRYNIFKQNMGIAYMILTLLYEWWQKEEGPQQHKWCVLQRVLTHLDKKHVWTLVKPLFDMARTP